jgi:hypothetical protein
MFVLCLRYWFSGTGVGLIFNFLESRFGLFPFSAIVDAGFRLTSGREILGICSDNYYAWPRY